jgi:hypothetical protein
VPSLLGSTWERNDGNLGSYHKDTPETPAVFCRAVAAIFAKRLSCSRAGALLLLFAGLGPDPPFQVDLARQPVVVEFEKIKNHNFQRIEGNSTLESVKMFVDLKVVAAAIDHKAATAPVN